MFLNHLELVDFRNYTELTVDFSHHKVILLGENAQGKTNLLEAIGLLATGKSPSASKDAELIRWGAEQAIIRAEVTRELTGLSIHMLVRAAGKRAVRINGLPQKRLADLFGKLLVVLFRAEDMQLVKGGPAERRDYMDTMLVQLHGGYHAQLIDYQRVVSQRNSLLRAIGEGTSSAGDLATWDEPLITLAIGVWRRRLALIAALTPHVAQWHAHIARGKETLALRYLPSVPLAGERDAWEAAMRATLAEVRRKELARMQTLVGPHRDDLELTIDGRCARAFGSQGQQRTAVLALKLAELDHVRATAGEAPILLLDDVLAELDVGRQNALLSAIGPEVQTFVTTTHLNDFSAAWLESAAIHYVLNGRLNR